MTAKDMVIEALRGMGADGLCSPDHDCGCGLNDMAPCDCSFLDCEPARQKIAAAEDLDEESEYQIGDTIYCPIPQEPAGEEAKKRLLVFDGTRELARQRFPERPSDTERLDVIHALIASQRLDLSGQKVMLAFLEVVWEGAMRWRCAQNKIPLDRGFFDEICSLIKCTREKK